MPEFSARVVDKNTGKEFKILLSADDERHAASQAQAMGFSVLNVQPIRSTDPEAVFRGLGGAPSEPWRPGSALNSVASFLVPISIILGALGALFAFISTTQMMMTKEPTITKAPNVTELIAALSLAFVGWIIAAAALEVSQGKVGQSNAKMHRILVRIWIASIILIPLLTILAGSAFITPK